MDGKAVTVTIDGIVVLKDARLGKFIKHEDDLGVITHEAALTVSAEEFNNLTAQERKLMAPGASSS